MSKPDPIRRTAEQIEIGVNKGYFTPWELLAKLDPKIAARLVAAYHEMMIRNLRCPYCGQSTVQTKENEKVLDAMGRLEDAEA
ncbi:MAG: hypothetical protein HY619_07855 [Thaumarchaeota archaeon]|nr:hypothetical protein [Nitrososphaerota archaeon]